ncbi:MAG: cation transporter [Bacilli bacterium]|nr:cation transporter [Bacilli bacterium]
MTKLLIRLFIKNHDKINDTKVRAKYGVLSGIVGIIVNLILCSVKIFAGLISGSLSIMADGINNLSDAGSSIVTMVGFKLATLPPDEEHPFGHERIEYISGMIVAFIIIIIGLSLLKSSIEKIIEPTLVETNIYVYIILGLSMLFKLWQGIFNKKIGKKINSTAILATSQDSLNDVISTFVVLVGIIFTALTDYNIDGILGVLVSVFILKSGLDLVKETTKPLIGDAPTKEEINEISNKILSYEGILGIHDLVFHSYGPNKKFITVHTEVDSTVDVMISHDMIDNIERDFKHELNIDLVIHMDPVNIKDEKTNFYKGIVLEIVNNYDPCFSIHDFRIVSGPTHTNILFDLVIPVKYKLKPYQVKQEIKELISQYDDKLIAVIQVDQLYDRNN